MGEEVEARPGHPVAAVRVAVVARDEAGAADLREVAAAPRPEVVAVGVAVAAAARAPVAEVAAVVEVADGDAENRRALLGSALLVSAWRSRSAEEPLLCQGVG